MHKNCGEIFSGFCRKGQQVIGQCKLLSTVRNGASECQINQQISECAPG